MEKYTTSIEIDFTPRIPEKGEDERKSDYEDSERFSSYEKYDEDEVRGRVKRHGRVHRKGSVRFYLVNLFFGIAICLVVLYFLIITLFNLQKVEYEGVVNSNTVEIEKTLFSDSNCSNAIYAWIINQVKDYGPIPFVKSSSVYLKNKNTVVVSVKEDELAGYFSIDGGRFVYFDPDGRVNEISKKRIENLPVVKGIKLGEQNDGDLLAIDSVKLAAITDLIKYAKSAKITPEIIMFDPDNTYGFYMGNVFVDLGIPSNVREKINRLPYILPNLEGRTGVLHMEEWSRDNTDIVFEITGGM